MQSKESLYPEDWFRIGEKERRRAENLLKLGDLEGAAFNIHQTIEKYLKGYLLSKGWKLRRIHDLEVLLNDAIVYESSFEKFRDICQKITHYYLEERYPFTVASEFTEEEIRDSLNSSRKMLQRIVQLTR